MIIRRYGLLLIFLMSCDFTSRISKEVYQAQEHLKKLEYDEAIQSFEKVLSSVNKRNEKVKILYQLGTLYLNIHFNPLKSKQTFKEILQLSDDPGWLIKTEEKIAQINFDYLKNYNEATTGYLKLINFKPKLERHDFYHMQLGKSLLFSGDKKKALIEFNRIKNEKKHLFRNEALFYIGITHFYEKEWDLAIESWINYVKLDIPENKKVLAKLFIANAYETKEDLPKAYSYYYSILSYYPHFEVVKYRLKSLYARRVARKR